MAPIDAVFIGIEKWKERHLALVDSGQITIVHGAQDVIWNCQTVYTNYKIRMIYEATPSAWPLTIDRNVSSYEIEACNLPVLHVIVILDDMLEKLRSRKEGNMPIELNNITSVKLTKIDNDKFLKTAKAAVVCWYNEHNAPATIGMEDVYIVWFSKVLQNWKALAGTHHSDGMYYEITYDGNKEVAYVDAYKKWDNVRMTSELLKKVAEK